MEILNYVTNVLDSVCNFLRNLIICLCLIALCMMIVRSMYFKCKNIFLTKEGPQGLRVFLNCSLENKKKIWPIIETLPEALCWLFTHDGFKLCVLSHKQYIKGPGGKLPHPTIGLFDPHAKMIFIDAERPIEELKDTIYHEFGYYCDFVDGGYLGFGGELDVVTRTCYEKMREDTMIPPYYRNNIVEFVAYCASHAICSPQILSEEMFAIGQQCFEKVYEKAHFLEQAEKG